MTFGYTHENPLGVRVAFLVMALFVVIGYFIFQILQAGRYPRGNPPELEDGVATDMSMSTTLHAGRRPP